MPSSFRDRIGKTQGIALRITPPRKASNSACHQETPGSAGGSRAGLALISNARSAPSSPRKDSTPSSVDGAAVPAAAFGNTSSNPSARGLRRGTAAASISASLFGKNIAVGFGSPETASDGTNNWKSCEADANRVSNDAG